MRSGKGRKPRLLSHVVKAVKHLKENKGSSAGRITDQVRTLINRTKLRPKPRNVVMQVRRALNHAVQTGILLHRAGRYKVLKSRNIVPVDSLELCDIHSGRHMRKTRGRRYSNRRRRRSRTRRRRRRRSHSRSHSRNSSLSGTPEPKRRRQQKRKPKNKVSFKDKANRVKKDKEKTAQDNGQKSINKPQQAPNENQTKVSQRPKTPYVSFEETNDADEGDTVPNGYERPRRQRQQTAGARNRSVSRPRSSKPSRQSRRPMDDAEILPTTLIRSARSLHRSPDRQQQKSSSDLNQPEHDDTSSDSMPDDDDDNQERDTSNSYLN